MARSSDDFSRGFYPFLHDDERQFRQRRSRARHRALDGDRERIVQPGAAIHGASFAHAYRAMRCVAGLFGLGFGLYLAYQIAFE